MGVGWSLGCIFCVWAAARGRECGGCAWCTRREILDVDDGIVLVYDATIWAMAEHGLHTSMASGVPTSTLSMIIVLSFPVCELSVNSRSCFSGSVPLSLALSPLNIVLALSNSARSFFKIVHPQMLST